MNFLSINFLLEKTFRILDRTLVKKRNKNRQIKGFFMYKKGIFFIIKKCSKRTNGTLMLLQQVLNRKSKANDQGNKNTFPRSHRSEVKLNCGGCNRKSHGNPCSQAHPPHRHPLHAVTLLFPHPSSTFLRRSLCHRP